MTLWGESHGGGIGVTIDGVRAGIPLSEDDFATDLARRAGGARGTTPRREPDRPQIVSGLYQGHTTGAPLTVYFENTNTRSSDYASLLQHPRPSHADLTARRKFDGYNDPRGGGHFSGRLTLALVAAGVVAKKMLPQPMFKMNGDLLKKMMRESGITFRTSTKLVAVDSTRTHTAVTVVVECRIDGMPAGVGEPFFDSVESVMSHLLFSIPAVKGVEFGAGFASARLHGSENNDPIVDAEGHTSTNHDGGINGGITNGNEIVVRVAIKPTPSISRPQQTYDFAAGRVEELTIHGRHDACIALRAVVVVEAVAAIALADLSLTARGRA